MNYLKTAGQQKSIAVDKDLNKLARERSGLRKSCAKFKITVSEFLDVQRSHHFFKWSFQGYPGGGSRRRSYSGRAEFVISCVFTCNEYGKNMENRFQHVAKVIIIVKGLTAC
jgi:hypothetical protein